MRKSRFAEARIIEMAKVDERLDEAPFDGLTDERRRLVRRRCDDDHVRPRSAL